MSNTLNLILHKGYSGVLIEGNAKLFAKLERNFAGKANVIPIKRYVGFTSQDGLDSILLGTPIPNDFDLLSIDIDGNDYHVWDAIVKYRPKVVIIEFNPTIPSHVDFIQPRDMKVSQGNSILSLTKLAKQKGYELIATTKLNAIYVDSKYFSLFDISDNSIETLRVDNKKITYVFHGYDGTIFIDGYGYLNWHEMPYNVRKMQQLPRFLRGPRTSWPKRVLVYGFRILRKKHLV